MMVEMLTERQVWSALAGLDAGMFGKNVVFQQQVGSTNDIARQLAEEHAPEGTLVIAEEQTAGRGRLGRTWESPPGVSLMQSILFRPDIEAGLANRLVMAVGLAAADACEAVADVRIDVKWPNDLQISGRKVAGILPESALVGDRLAWVVVGIGINVNQEFADDHPLAGTATSLRMAAGQEIDRLTVLREMLVRLAIWYVQIRANSLYRAWMDRCVTLGQRVQIRVGDSTVEGIAEDLDLAGALWVRADDGNLRLVSAGEATIL